MFKKTVPYSENNTKLINALCDQTAIIIKERGTYGWQQALQS
jgi:hypothetical protein